MKVVKNTGSEGKSAHSEAIHEVIDYILYIYLFIFQIEFKSFWLPYSTQISGSIA